MHWNTFKDALIAKIRTVLKFFKGYMWNVWIIGNVIFEKSATQTSELFPQTANKYSMLSSWCNLLDSSYTTLVPAPCDGNNVTFSLSQTDHELRTTHPYVEQSQTTMSEAQTFRVMFLWKYYYITWGIMRILRFIYFDWYISVHNANWMKFDLHSFWNVIMAYIKLEVNYILLRYILEWHYNTVAYIF